MGRSFRRKKERWAEPSNQLANAQKQKGSQIHNWGRLIVNRWGQAFPNALGLLMKLWATFCFLWFFDASFLSVPMPDKKVLSNMCIVHRLRANFHIYNFFFSFDFPRVISTIGTQLCSSQRGDVIVLKRVNKLIVEIKNIKSQRYIYIYISFLLFSGLCGYPLTCSSFWFVFLLLMWHTIFGDSGSTMYTNAAHVGLLGS